MRLVASGSPSSPGVRGRTGPMRLRWPSRPPGSAKCHMFGASPLPPRRRAAGSSSAGARNLARSVAGNAIAMARWGMLGASTAAYVSAGWSATPSTRRSAVLLDMRPTCATKGVARGAVDIAEDIP